MPGNRNRLTGLSPWRYYGPALAAALLVWLLSAFVIWQARNADYASAARAGTNTARLVADDIGKSLAQVGSLLKSIGRQYVDGLDSGPEEMARLAGHMKEEIGDFPIVARITVADASGRPVLQVGGFPAGSAVANVSDTGAVRRAAAGEHGTIFEGPASGPGSPTSG